MGDYDHAADRREHVSIFYPDTAVDGERLERLERLDGIDGHEKKSHAREFPLTR